MNITFNKTPVTIKDVPYTNIEDCLKVLNEKGFCFLENVVDITFDHTKYIDNNLEKFEVVEEFNTKTIEYSIISEQIYKSALLKQLSKANSIYVSNIDLRCFKNHSGTFLHKDSDIFYDRVFDFDVITCWTPLLNTSFSSGVIAIVDRFINDELRLNAVKRKIPYINKKDYPNKHNLSIEKISEGFKSDKEIYLKEKDEWCKYGKEFYAKELKIGDVALFTKETLHGALDTNEGIRASLDFRIAIIPNEKKYILNSILNDLTNNLS